MRALRFPVSQGPQTAGSLSQRVAFQVETSFKILKIYSHFSLDKDPYEKNNVFGDNKDTVWTLLEKLAQYDANSVPTFYPPRDPAADPAAHDGWWGPWKAGPNNWPR